MNAAAGLENVRDSRPAPDAGRVGREESEPAFEFDPDLDLGVIELDAEDEPEQSGRPEKQRTGMAGLLRNVVRGLRPSGWSVSIPMM